MAEKEGGREEDREENRRGERRERLYVRNMLVGCPPYGAQQLVKKKKKREN